LRAAKARSARCAPALLMIFFFFIITVDIDLLLPHIAADFAILLLRHAQLDITLILPPLLIRHFHYWLAAIITDITPRRLLPLPLRYFDGFRFHYLPDIIIAED
jgi:hypothetical protein